MKKMKVLFPVLWTLVLLQCTLAQPQSDSVRNHVTSVVKSHFGSNYYTCDVLDVDTTLAWWADPPYFAGGPISEDSAGQLRHCRIAIYAKLLADDTSGLGLEERNCIAIIRNDSVVWHSAPLLHNCCGAGGRILGFCDVNNDGVTDILVSDATGAIHGIEDLWIISPDSKGGTLLNTIDDIQRSTITGAFDSFDLSSRDRRGRRIITALDPGSEPLRKILYKWNGNHYVRSRR